MSDAKTISNATLTTIRRLGKLSLALALLAPAAACDEDPWDPNYSEDFQARAGHGGEGDPAGYPCAENSDCDEGLICSGSDPGECVEDDSQSECSDDDDCSDDETCLEWECVSGPQ